MRIKLASFNVAGFAVLQLLLRLSAGLTGAGASLLAQIPTIFQEPDTHYAVHHTVVSASSWSKSLRFYVDGLGLNIIRIHTFQGDLTTLFGTNTSVLPSYFLGDTTSVHNGTDGVTYLVEFPDAKKIPTVDSNPPDTGLFLTSFWMGDKINATLEYLHRLGIGGKPHIATFSFGSEPLATYATVRDPEGPTYEPSWSWPSDINSPCSWGIIWYRQQHGSTFVVSGSLLSDSGNIHPRCRSFGRFIWP